MLPGSRSARLLFTIVGACWLLLLGIQYHLLISREGSLQGVIEPNPGTFDPPAATAASFLLANNSISIGSSSYAALARRIGSHGPRSAYDERGGLGYVHDPTTAAQRSQFRVPPGDFSEVCAPPGMGTDEDVSGYRALTQEVQINPNPHPVRILCIVYTYPGGVERTNAILETWGKKCDGFMAASTYTNASAGLVRIPHQGEEGAYNSIWQKVRSILFYVFWNYRDSYDFFHVSGDDAFVIVENMKAYLESAAIVEAGGGPGYPDPLYIGQWVHRYNFEYAGGGPGYTLNRAALAGFISNVYRRCDADLETPFEDLQFGKCYKRYMRKKPIHGLDGAGRPLYLGYNPLVACNGNCSSGAVAFHHARSPAIIRRWYKLLYRRNETDCFQDLRREPGAVLLPENAKNRNKHRFKSARVSAFQQKAKVEGK